MTEGDTERTETEQRLTVSEVADALGISSEAIRTRIQRGTLRSVREGGRVFVLFDPDGTQSNTDRTYDQTQDQAALVDELPARVAFLERELRDRTEEARRKDHLLAADLERIPALEPPEEPESASEVVPETPHPRSRRCPQRRSRGGVGLARCYKRLYSHLRDEDRREFP